ncbi:hypothetical protein JHK84_031224 [Glycine max]|nr:hypothetical protein JHK84_031224 [Glycine max]
MAQGKEEEGCDTKTKRIEYMATNNYTVHNEKTSFPQRRRGQIKAQIFSSMVEFVASIFSKDEKDKDDNNNDGGSAISTPPSTAYNSDGF